LQFTANFEADASAVQYATHNENWRVFPNPTNGLLHFAFGTALTTDADMELFSADGRLVQRQKISAGATQCSTDCSMLPAGVYYVWCSNTAHTSRMRFVKQ
jgi:hypothetical protein